MRTLTLRTPTVGYAVRTLTMFMDAMDRYAQRTLLFGTHSVPYHLVRTAYPTIWYTQRTLLLHFHGSGIQIIEC